MSNPNPSPATRFKTGGHIGRASTAWIRERLSRKNPDGQTAREEMLDHLLEVATKWEIKHFGETVTVASGRDSVEAARLILAYAIGAPPKLDPVALAEHFRQVEKDRVDLALHALGQRIHSMDAEELRKLFRECAADPTRFLEAAQRMLAAGNGEAPEPVSEVVDAEAAPAQVEALPAAEEAPEPPQPPTVDEEPGPCS